jgi:nuclear GTP-binding protein
LKGVVRVEALPTPSDHIQALMDRVKPIYLSRTYGVPLPDKDNPTEAWKPEVFLDKIARMKGRLLKHGEPDLDAVAKIVLSDWVRGRIPYFVPPPERSEELNEAEAKKKRLSKAKDVKGKSKATEGEVLGVKQNLKSLMQKNTFVAEDVQPMDEEFEEAAEDDDETDEGADVASNPDDTEDDEEELKWDDVFEGIKDDVPASGEPSQDENEEEIVDMSEGLLIITPLALSVYIFSR